MWGACGDEGEEKDDEGQDPAQKAGHQAGPSSEVKPVWADDGPPVDSQRHLDQQEGQEAPEEEERVELAEDRVELVVPPDIVIHYNGNNQ